MTEVTPRIFTIPEITVDKFILSSDWHVPYHDEDMVEKLLEAACTYNVSTLMIVGDFIDFPTISRFEPRDIEADGAVGYEVREAGRMMNRLTDAGLSIHWTRGNHELRFFRQLKHQVTITDLMRIMGVDGGVTGYEGEEVYVQSGAVKWLLSHPQQYNSTPLAVARKLQHKYGGSIATAHNHQYAYAVAPNGVAELVEVGGLFHPGKLAYLWRGGASALPTQTQGFWIVDEGKVVKP